MTGLIRHTDPLPLRELPPALLDLLDEAAEPGGQLEEILAARPDALVVLALDPDRAWAAAVATKDGDLASVYALERHGALHAGQMREAVMKAARERWPGWVVKEVTHAA